MLAKFGFNSPEKPTHGGEVRGCGIASSHRQLSNALLGEYVACREVRQPSVNQPQPLILPIKRLLLLSRLAACSAPHRLTPPGSQLRPRHAYSRSTWVHCQDIHAHLHHLAPCTPRPPLFSAYSVARPCGVCFTKSDGFGGESVNFQSKKKTGCNRKLVSSRNFCTRFF